MLVRYNYKCMICGRKIARRIKLPAGSIRLCSDQKCLDTLNHRVNDAIPVVWFSYNDLINHEVAALEVLEHKLFHNEGLVRELAEDVDDFIWGGETLGEMFHDALVEAGQKLEKNFIAAIPKKDVPLYINVEWKSDEARELYQKLLTGGK
jgi:hypothetical protein